MRGIKTLDSMLLQAAQLDALNILAWQNTKDATKGRNKPKSIYNDMIGKNKSQDIMTFSSGKEFAERRKKLLER